jgi:pimeloyl-ACP methyl ester carboxylesterase
MTADDAWTGLYGVGATGGGTASDDGNARRARRYLKSLSLVHVEEDLLMRLRFSGAARSLGIRKTAACMFVQITLKTLAFAALVSAGCSNASSVTTQNGTSAVIPCNQVSTLRALHGRLSVVTNPGTGDSVEYAVVGDGAVSNDLLLMFPGTGQTLAGWPVQLITNVRYSPHIAGTLGYNASEDGSVSLCHNYRILLFDYPGVGKTAFRPALTRDRIASDVDAVLENVHRTSGIDTDRVDPIGWSLGTTMAMKYAFLSPASRPTRSIHNIVLIATGPGGSLQGHETHDSAACIQTLFNASLRAGGLTDFRIKALLSELVFPFQGQTQTENGTMSGCMATVSGSRITLSVKPDCTFANLCKPYFHGVLIANKTYPWILTNGIGTNIYAEERRIASDWYLNYCARAAPHFTSLDCSSYGPVQISKTNGGICKTDTSNLDRPTARDCDRIKLTGKVTVIAGYEDLLDQWTYGKAVVDGYHKSQGPQSARLVIYPGSAGHGLMIQHPKWTEAQIDTAIRQ